MENKINIAQLLKDCPQGMELDCAMWDNVTLKGVNIGFTYPIEITYPVGEELFTAELTEYGCWSLAKTSKCVIFPKGKTTWEGFVPPCEFIEKLVEPKFKVGDRIQNIYNGKQFTITKIYQDYYECDDRYVLAFENQDIWELVPDKFDITSLIPFESRVLVRDYDDDKWQPGIWGFYDKGATSYPYKLIGDIVRYCIPYEGNKHLLGKTDDCDNFYKTWE